MRYTSSVGVWGFHPIVRPARKDHEKIYAAWTVNWLRYQEGTLWGKDGADTDPEPSPDIYPLPFVKDHLERNEGVVLDVFQPPPMPQASTSVYWYQRLPRSYRINFNGPPPERIKEEDLKGLLLPEEQKPPTQAVKLWQDGFSFDADETKGYLSGFLRLKKENLVPASDGGDGGPLQEEHHLTKQGFKERRLFRDLQRKAQFQQQQLVGISASGAAPDDYQVIEHTNMLLAVRCK
ncbi:unnamed protein product [Amoebophrya sp. A120]|nr:unnamed protein product [Amoebophrya sp. A120]|eukprot:GSA120T00004518001.1